MMSEKVRFLKLIGRVVWWMPWLLFWLAEAGKEEIDKLWSMSHLAETSCLGMARLVALLVMKACELRLVARDCILRRPYCGPGPWLLTMENYSQLSNG